MAPRAAGVLVVNLGSPDAPTPRALRRFLAEFLSDRRVVDRPPPLLWQPLLRGLILPLRSPRSAALYARVWTAEGAPLLAHGRRLAAALQQRLGGEAHVVLAMRYGEPSIRAGLADLLGRSLDRLLVLPLFPQFAEATVGSIRAAVTDALGDFGPRFAAEFVEPPCDAPGYIAALAARVRQSLQAGPVDHHVFSFHGLPQRQVDRGDPYRTQCETTARALAAALQLPAERWTLVFQSRFGPDRWLTPYADEAVPALAARARRVLITCPGFAADCLETLDEIGTVLAARFRAAGGEELRLVPCLNDHPLWVDELERLLRDRLSRSVA